MRVLKRYGRILTPTPNWLRSVEMQFSFKTGIIDTYDGRSQRFAMRETPRLGIIYGTNLSSAGVHRHAADLAESQNEPFHVRSPWQACSLTETAGVGATEITVDEVPHWLTAGVTLILTGPSVEEAVVVADVSGQSVTLVDPLSDAQPAGAEVAFSYLARVNPSVEFIAQTDEVWTGQVQLTVDPGTVTQTIPVGSPELFEGREVLLLKPNWQQRPKITLSEIRDTVDSSRGVIHVESPTGRMVRSHQWTYTGMGVAQAEAFIGFYVRMKGQRGAFWAPTWQRDFSPVAVGSNFFDVADLDAFYGYAESDIHKVVIARWGGSHQVNRITSIAIQGQNTRFTFASAWDQGITAQTELSWCFLSRLSADNLGVSWATNTTMNANLNLITIPYESPANGV